jgi:uncharacterized protein
MTTTESIADLPVEDILRLRFGIEKAQLVAIGQRFHIIEMGLFGSALRDDFRPDGDDPSDVDLLITFEPNYHLSWQEWLALETEVEALFRHKVDLCVKRRLQNPYSKTEILRTTRVIYEPIC